MNDPCNCPIALAIQDVVGDRADVLVNNFCAWIGPEEFELPVEARFYVDRWDRGQPCEDITFDLDIPAELLRTEGRG